MGVDSRKPPPLPAPTEDTESTITKSDLAPSDLSKPSDDKSSYSLPEDGTPVTIKTRGHKSNKSQTSLLIEYFEGGKVTSSGGSGDRKPSVRVRLTPSKNRKTDHIQITETKMAGGRKAALTRRADRAAPLTPTQVRSDEALSVLSAGDAEDARSFASYQSATEESNVSRNPIEVDIDRSGRQRRRRPASPLIPSTDSKASYQPGDMSEISAIPTDSFLDGSGPSSRYEEKRSKSPSRAREVLGGAAAGLAAAAMADKMRSKSRSETADYERAVLPKSRDRERSERRHKSRSRKSSGSEHHSETAKSSSRRRSSKEHKQETVLSGADSSVLSSAVSHGHRSIDASSMHSGASKSSINNPKLLETVEDAIRRLILPELSAIKREQSKREARRGSVSSAATGSKEETETDSMRQGYSSKSRETLGRRISRDREARHELLESPAPSVDHDSVDESLHEIEEVPRNHDKLKAAAAGAALGALAENLHRNKSPAIAREQRRRRRAEAKSRLSERYGDDGQDLEPAPPMPLMSELNQSDITRTSILSAETDSHSASEELTPILQVSKGTLSIDSRSTGTGSSTPTRDVNTQPALGMQHANISHGDLRTLPQRRTGGLEGEYEQEYMRKAPIHDVYEDDEEYEDDQGYNNYYNTQEVPPPLKYVPYEPERRGLSPIPSVSGYTEGGSELYRDRESRISHRTADSYPSPDKSLRRGGASPSLLSQESWRDDRSVASSRGGNRNTTYTEDSELDHFTTGTAMRAVGARGDLIASPAGVQSHVASLVEGSSLTDSIGTGDQKRNSQQYNKRASAAAMEAAAMLGDDSGQMAASSREQTPEPPRVVDEDTVSELSEDQDPRRSEHFEEYDLDKYGRKIPISKYRHSPTASEAAITGAAVGAAAAALRAAAKGKGKQQPEEEFVGEGVSRNKSFKDRTREGYLPANTPTHSIDRLDEFDMPTVGHSGLPDASDPLPEIGYFAHDSDALTNPSRMSDRLSATEEANRRQWDDEEPATPTQESVRGKHNLTLDEAAGAAAVATAAALAHAHSQQFSDGMDDDWYRTDEDRKRDTIVTNPYEGTSPLANAPGLDIELPSHATQYDFQNYANYGARSPFGPKIDEGYISQGPNRTPDNKGQQPMDFSAQHSMPAGTEALFNAQDPQYMNGMSQALGSPMYEAATGTGIEQIESKDIIALMQHLMVRDAQRSARDTEILVTLVRTAAEMRNSFDDIKRMLADTEDVIITEVKDNTEKTVQRHLGGPRPFPGSASRSIQGGSQGGSENEKKTRNLWQRALKGLSTKGTNDLTRIEDMLVQLLGEVDVLKSQTAQGGMPPSSGPSMDNLQPAIQYEQDRGYEPEGHAGTSTASYASQSGQLSIPRNPSAGYQRKVSSGNRISTVPEGDEEDHFEDSNVVIHSRSDADMTSPVHMASPVQEIARADSEPLGSPFQMPVTSQPPMSNENMGRPEKGKKHKSSGSSSWFPKISRWSETTASSVGKAFRKSKEVDAHSFQAPSRSNSSIGDYEDYPVEPISTDQLHSGFPDPNLHPQSRRHDPNQIETDMTFTLAGVSRTPLSMDQQPQSHPVDDEHVLPENPFLKHCDSPEDPKYRAHRNSLNLQHPQPRNGQTEHFRTLETSAQEFDQPMSPESANWGSVTSLSRFTAGQPRFGAGSSLSQEQGQYTWEGSTASPVAGSSSNNNNAPQRPPKEPLDSISSPTRGVTPTRNRISALGYKPAGSPKPENRNLQNVRGGPARRPSGPRAMGTRSPAPPSEGMAEDPRRKRDTFGTVASSSQDSDTF